MGSKYTRRHLEALSSSESSYLSPLSVIAHIDLDAFYAQCERVRLGLHLDAPVVCRQWNGLIAISYAARAFGITRHENADSAKQKCPEIVLSHVATYRKGEDHWEYHDKPDSENYKVSLDPYRRESRKIFALIAEYTPHLEKASIDETYVDLGPMLYKQVYLLFPQLAEASYDAPLPSISDLKAPKLTWEGVVLYEDKTPEHQESLDWDDLLMILASQKLAEIRTAVFDRLGYTCSAGLARNKRLAKLACGTHKPNRQTIVRNTGVVDFLDGVAISEIGGFGGKLGRTMLEALHLSNDASIAEVRHLSLRRMQNLLGQELGAQMYGIVQGTDNSQVSPRTDIKSMQSTKNFPQGLPSRADCVEWLQVYAADLTNRVLELDAETSVQRRPRTIALQTRQFTPVNFSRGKQTSISVYLSDPAEIRSIFFKSACDLLEQIEKESKHSIYPSVFLSLNVSNFHLGEALGFQNITKTFRPKCSSATDSTPNSQAAVLSASAQDLFVSDGGDGGHETTCGQCGAQIPEFDMQIHTDWHLAVKLERGLQGSQVKAKPPHSSKSGTPKKAGSRVDKQQSLLKFTRNSKSR